MTDKPDRSKWRIVKRNLGDPEPEPPLVSPEETSRIMHALARSARAFGTREEPDVSVPGLQRHIVRVIRRPG